MQGRRPQTSRHENVSGGESGASEDDAEDGGEEENEDAGENEDEDEDAEEDCTNQNPKRPRMISSNWRMHPSTSKRMRRPVARMQIRDHNVMCYSSTAPSAGTMVGNSL